MCPNRRPNGAAPETWSLPHQLPERAGESSLAAAGGSAAYETAQSFFAHPLIRVLLIGFSFAFFYHLLNGVRHLTWDTGHGLERQAARLSGWIVFLGAIACTALFWFLVVRGHGGGAA